MKITHRVPSAGFFRAPESATVSPEYEAEVQRSTEKGERLYRLAQERLERAEAKLARAKAASAKGGRTAVKRRQREIAELESAVELRRAELAEYRRTMEAAPASAEHRGTKSFRPVPPRHGSGL